MNIKSVRLVGQMDPFFKPGASMTPLQDESVFRLVDHLFGSAGAVKTPTGGWRDEVCDEYERKHHAAYSDETYPFIVGGVGTNNGKGYAAMRTIVRAVAGWNGVLAGGSAQACVELLRAATEVSAPIVFPPNTQMASASAAMPSMLVDMERCVALLAVWPDGLPGCLAPSTIVDTDYVFAKLLVRSIEAVSKQIEAAGASLADLCMALGWYNEVQACKLTFDAEGQRVLQLVHKQLEAAHRSDLVLEPCLTASAKIKTWKSMADIL